MFGSSFRRLSNPSSKRNGRSKSEHTSYKCVIWCQSVGEKRDKYMISICFFNFLFGFADMIHLRNEVSFVLINHEKTKEWKIAFIKKYTNFIYNIILFFFYYIICFNCWRYLPENVFINSILIIFLVSYIPKLLLMSNLYRTFENRFIILFWVKSGFTKILLMTYWVTTMLVQQYLLNFRRNE